VSILSDQSGKVHVRIVGGICRLFDVDKLRESPYKLSTNQVARLRRIFNTIIGKTVEDHQRDGDTRLPCAMAAYRASRHERLLFAEFSGREVRGPIDIVYGVAEGGPIKETYDSFVEMILSRMTYAYADVRKAFKSSAERNKRYYQCK